MLLAIALCPLWVPDWWESNRNKLAVAAALGLPVLALYLARRPAALLGMAEDYVSFMVLLAGLYVMSGGIRLTGDLEATPLTNSVFLAVGTLLASFIGTTGASMLLIRPLLQTNRERRHVKHTVIFFIFLVSNVGGMLTPLGDPPLFLGYLSGVPFAWTFRLWPQWLFMVAVLLLLYFVWDTRRYVHEPLAALRRDRAEIEPLRLRGGLNALGLALVVLAVAFLHAPWRESAFVAVAAAALWRAAASARRGDGVPAQRDGDHARARAARLRRLRSRALAEPLGSGGCELPSGAPARLADARARGVAGDPRARGRRVPGAAGARRPQPRVRARRAPGD